MASQDRSGLATDIAADFADNSAGDISAQDMRDMLTDLVDSNFNLTDDTSDDITEGVTNLLMTVSERSLVASSLQNIAEDITPQLGGALDGQTFDMDNIGSITLGVTKQSLVFNGLTFSSLIHSDADGFADFAEQLFARHSDVDTQSPVVFFARSSGTHVSPTIIEDGDRTGSVHFYGYDGTDYHECAAVRAEILGTPLNNVMPGVLKLDVNSGGAIATNVLNVHGDGSIEFAQTISTPSVNPSAGGLKVYFKGAGLFGLLDTGAEIDLRPINTVFGRTGSVVATNGDYTASQVTNVAAGGIAAITVQAAIDELDTEKQAAGDVLDDFNTLGAPGIADLFIVSTGVGAFAYETGATARTSMGALGDVIDDTSPTLGGNLDGGDFDIDNVKTITMGITAETLVFNGLSLSSLLHTDANDSAAFAETINARHSDTATFAPAAIFVRSGGSHASQTIVSDGDTLGMMQWTGHDGTDYHVAAQISALVDGTPANNDIPGEIVFSTNAGAATATVILSMKADGSLELNQEITTPANAASNSHKMYFKTDDNLYTLNDAGVEVNVTTGMPTTADITVPIISGATNTALDDIMDLILSAGLLTGGGITDDTDGTITVAAGTGTIRATDSNAAQVVSTNFAAEAGANVALVDNSINFIYVEFNGGSPQVIATTSERTDTNTNFLIAEIIRAGTTLHIHEPANINIANHTSSMHLRMVQTLPFARRSGGSIAETGTRNFSISAGNWWEGLNEFSTASFDSAVADDFSYFFDDGAGGHTEVTTQTQIDNLQFDDGSGSLATLSNNRYGVHWVFLSSDGHITVLYGLGDYTLSQAENADLPADQPIEMSTSGARLVGKIIVQKSASTFTSVESAFDTTFETASPTDHENLTGLLGGAASDHFHLTAAQHAPLIVLGDLGAIADNEVFIGTGAGTGAYETGTTLRTSIGCKKVGKETLWVPATAMTPATTNGAATGQIETSTNKINVETLDFDKDTDEFAHFNIALPKSWNLGTITYQLFWTAATGGTTGIAFALQGVAIGDNVTNDTAYGTAVVVTDDAQTGANEIYVSAESSAITIANTPVDDDVCFFRLFRDVSDANDDLAEDAQLIGIKFHFTLDAEDDA